MRRIWAINRRIRVERNHIVVGPKRIPIRAVYEVWAGPKTLKANEIYRLLRRRVLIYFFDEAGFMGLATPMRTSYGLWTGKITVMQARAYMDKDMRMSIAREIVGAIIHNINVVYHWHIRKKTSRETTEKFKETIRRAKECLEKSDNVMLCEAKAWRALFGALRDVDKEFIGRIRHPPMDPLNALVSYINGLLYAQCLHAILLVGLDPMISFVHEPSPKRRFSLPLDIKDIFMPYITIRLALRLRRKLEEKHFVWRKRRGRKACFLSRRGRTIVVGEFRRILRSKFWDKTMYRIIVEEVERLGRAVVGGGEYRAWRIPW